MARVPLGLMTAAVLVGACSAAAVPPTNAAVQPPQVMHDDVDVPAIVDAPQPQPSPTPTPTATLMPMRAVEARSERKTPSDTKAEAKTFTRVVERKRIEARGVRRIDASEGGLRAALPRDNGAFSVDQRRELLSYLRGDVVKGDAEFTYSDARIVAKLQAGSGAVADGVLRDETMALLLTMGFHFSAPASEAALEQVRLEFFPGELEDRDAWNREIQDKVMTKRGGFRDVKVPEGEGTIYVRLGGSIVASYRARGGPPAPLVDVDEHVAVPTAPGAYKLGAGRSHVSSNWTYSQIPWGAEIRKSEDGVQYRSAGRTSWSWATRHAATPGALKVPLVADDFEDLPEVDRDGTTYSIWNKNDFGPLAWHLVPSDDLYVHTTPVAEEQNAQGTADAATSLELSHGCIHIDPRERDEMMQRGYLAEDVPFVVRRWDEHVLPDELRLDMIARDVT